MFLVVKRIRGQVSYINDGCYLGPWLWSCTKNHFLSFFASVFLTGMYFQIRDFVLSCPDCRSQRTKKTEVRSRSESQRLIWQVKLSFLFTPHFYKTYSPSSFFLIGASFFSSSHILIHTFSLTFSVLLSHFDFSFKCFLAHCIPLMMLLYLLVSGCLCLSGAGRQKMCHKDYGVTRRRHAEQAEESAGGGAVLWHHPAHERTTVLGPQSCSGRRQRSLPGNLHRNGLEHESRYRSHW